MRRSINTGLTIVLIYTLCVSTVEAVRPLVQERQKEVSESRALEAVKAADGAAAKVDAAREFVKNFPSSSARQEVVKLVVNEIGKLRDYREAVRLAEAARSFFTFESEQATLNPLLLDAYALTNRADDAFQLAAETLARDPDDLRCLIQITLTGVEQAKRKNKKYLTLTMQYGLRAIALIEANQKPPGMTEDTWVLWRAALPQLYQQTAVLFLIEGNSNEANVRLLKASSLDGHDPYPFAVLGRILDDEYTRRLEKFSTLEEGEAKIAEKKSLEELLDSIIDKYAHTVGLAIGRSQYQLLMRQVIPHLVEYYQFRHNHSTAGLQQLIDSYRQGPL